MSSSADVESPANLGASELRDLYAAGALSPVEAVEAVLARVDAPPGTTVAGQEEP